MEKTRNLEYRLLIIILLINIFYSYIFFVVPEVIIFSFVVFVPVSIYALKYTIDSKLIICMLLVELSIYLFYGIESFVLYSILIIIPVLIISYLIRQRMSFAKSAAFFSMILFVCILVAGILLKHFFNVDVASGYFNYIDLIKTNFINIYEEFIKFNINSKQEYTMVMESVNNVLYYMKYYFPAITYLLCMGVAFISIMSIRIVGNKLGLFKFNIKNIIYFNVSRKMLIFLIAIYCIHEFIINTNSYVYIAIDNMLLILMVMLFLLGILLELFMIKKVRNAGKRMLYIAILIFCLIFFQAYFIIVGFIDSLFHLRRKLNNA
ncbi:MAG: YybS family protein [Vallitalea sp.]|jgi:uncharacterized protein YybS (DUF2232 family)|nr:YybS family protein [Vallitalea sp.]